VAVTSAVVARLAGGSGEYMFKRIFTVLRHRWVDESDVHRSLPPDLLARLTTRVGESERKHTGEVRICVEASLPPSYLWRHLWHGISVPDLARQRATVQFGRLRVWDTASNNGVLIYLLFVEREIELLADRGVNAIVGAEQWQSLVQHMAQAFAAGRFEDGLNQALDEVSATLVEHFPTNPAAPNPNELPDQPALG
jgi:hypothetical protein